MQNRNFVYAIVLVGMMKVMGIWEQNRGKRTQLRADEGSKEMGNYRFRLSDMMPNAWFYKLKDMSKSRKQYGLKKNQNSGTTTSQKSNISQPRYSCYIATESRSRGDKFYSSPINTKASDTHFPDPPRKASKRRSQRKTIYKPSPKVVSSCSSGCSCHASANSVWTNKSIPAHSPDNSCSPIETSPEPGFRESLLSESDEDDSFIVPDSFDHQLASLSSSCNCNITSSTADIIIDMDDESFRRKIKKVDGYGMISDLELPPILTKPEKFNNEMAELTKFKRNSSKMEEIKAHRSLSVGIVKEESIKTHKDQKNNPFTRKSSSNSTPAGIKVRANSPRIASRKIQACARKSVSSSRNKVLSESFAVVKSSVDPQKDFRDSMLEMIRENNIRAPKDLEELLACYLSLNSKEYHDLIVKAFEQIWLEMTDLRRFLGFQVV